MGMNVGQNFIVQQSTRWERPVFENLIHDTDRSTAQEIMRVFLTSLRELGTPSSPLDNPAHIASLSHRLRSSSRWLGFSNFQNLCTTIDEEYKKNKQIDQKHLEELAKEASEILSLSLSEEFLNYIH